MYNYLRCSLFVVVQKQSQDIEIMSALEKFTFIMSNRDRVIIRELAIYVYIAINHIGLLLYVATKSHCHTGWQ